MTETSLGGVGIDAVVGQYSIDLVAGLKQAGVLVRGPVVLPLALSAFWIYILLHPILA